MVVIPGCFDCEGLELRLSWRRSPDCLARADYATRKRMANVLEQEIVETSLTLDDHGHHD